MPTIQALNYNLFQPLKLEINMHATIPKPAMATKFDQVLEDIADYVMNTTIDSHEAFETARLCLMDALGCGILALNFPACSKLLGPVVPHAFLPNGARVPGTNYELDPVQAAFNIGTMIRWLDFNDTWLAAEWGHPSDNLGAILAVADYVSRTRQAAGKSALLMNDVLISMIKAYEIQGILALKNSFNRQGLDHVILVKLASSALAAVLLGANKTQLLNTLSQVFVDGQSLRTYRHAPNTGSRKSWAAGDAGARAVRLALISLTDEMGYPAALSAPKWGFYDASFAGATFEMARPFKSYVIEHVLFKLAFPAEFHAQTAAEAAISLSSEIKGKIQDIQEIKIHTQEPGVRIISKKGPLNNYADRDHCIEYIVAWCLLNGNLDSNSYSDISASDKNIDKLRDLTNTVEDQAYTEKYYDLDERAIPNRVIVTMKTGEVFEKEVIYPLGHKNRRAESLSFLKGKFQNSIENLNIKSDELMKFYDEKNLDSINIYDLLNCIYK